MIEFNELHINQEGTKLSVDVSVLDLPYFTNIYIDKIDIDSQDTYVITGPSTTPVYTRTLDGSNKTLQLELTPEDLGVSFVDHMFFVYITVKGTPAEDTPDDMDRPVTLGVVVYLYPFYVKIMEYAGEVDADCDISKRFMNLLLRIKALELSINTEHYTLATSYWNKHFKGKLS